MRRNASSSTGDFAAFVARNVDPAYRFTTMAVGDVVAAQQIVHDALMAAWRAGSAWPPSAVDAAFGRRLVSECRPVLREATAARGATAAADIEGAIGLLEPDDQLVLVERLGIPGSIEPVATTLRGRGSLDRRVPRILETVAAHLSETAAGGLPGAPSAGGLPASNLRAGGLAPAGLTAPAGLAAPDLQRSIGELYAARDPGEAPTQLRWRLQRSLVEVEQASVEQAEIAQSAGWGFAIKTVLVVLMLTLAIALVSVMQLARNDGPIETAGTGPASPLTIAAVSVVRSGIQGPAVHVARTSTSLVASYQASVDWHVSDRECQPDVLGLLDQTGQAQWLGQLAGHVETMAGDLGSGQVYLSGPGPFCQPGEYTSSDAGRTWSSGATAAGGPQSPVWMGFDPSEPGHLLALDSSALHVSPDSGGTWQRRPVPGQVIGFDADGRLVAWRLGRFVDSHDEGATWLELGPGPATAPAFGAATPSGILVALADGLWWYPTSGDATLVHAGRILAIEPFGDGAVVVGTDGAGHPWLATATGGQLSMAALPAALSGLTVSAAQLAANDSGVAIALSGQTSTIAFAPFVR